MTKELISNFCFGILTNVTQKLLKNCNVKTVIKQHIFPQTKRQSSSENKQTLNLAKVSIKEFILLRRQKSFKKNRNDRKHQFSSCLWFWWEAIFLIFKKNVQTTPSWTVVDPRLLSINLRTSQRIKPQQIRINAHPMSDQLKACSNRDIISCTRGRPTRSYLNFPTLTLVRESCCKRLQTDGAPEVGRRRSESDVGLTLETSTSESLYGGQFTLSTQLIKPNYLVTLPVVDRALFN